MADTEDNIKEAAEKSKNIAARHPMRTGAVTMAALFSTGYLLGQKRAESQSMYTKLKRSF